MKCTETFNIYVHNDNSFHSWKQLFTFVCTYVSKTSYSSEIVIRYILLTMYMFLYMSIFIIMFDPSSYFMDKQLVSPYMLIK